MRLFLALGLLASLGACAELMDFRDEIRSTVKDVSGDLVDDYCKAVPGSDTQQQVRDRLHQYLDERIVTEIDCGQPT